MKFISLILLFGLAACEGQPPEPKRDATDPAVAEALFQPLMTDVDMRAAAAPDALRPADQPATMQIPLDAVIDVTGAPTLGQVAAVRLREPPFAACSPAIGYSAKWSLRLPDWLELPDGARLVEAAGSDAPACALRIVRFGMPGTPAQMLDRFAVVAKAKGFGIHRSAASLTALRTSDGAAFGVYATAIASGTRVDLLSNAGAKVPTKH